MVRTLKLSLFLYISMHVIVIFLMNSGTKHVKMVNVLSCLDLILLREYWNFEKDVSFLLLHIQMFFALSHFELILIFLVCVARHMINLLSRSG